MELGTLTRIVRYPVKSMAGEDLDETLLLEDGIPCDRAYAFWDQQSSHYRPKLPYLTGRDVAHVIRFQPYEHDGQLMIGVPADLGGGAYPLDSPAFKEYIKEQFGRTVELQFSPRGLHDASPISLVGMQSLRALADRLSKPLDPCAFRENLYIEWNNPDDAFLEDRLVGEKLRIGDATLRIDELNGRCPMIGLDPRSGNEDRRVLKHVAKERKGKLGVYASVIRPGRVRTGESVRRIHQ